MRFTMHTVQGYLVRTSVGGTTHIITTTERNVGLELGDEVELVLPGGQVSAKAHVVGLLASVDPEPPPGEAGHPPISARETPA